MTDQLIKLARPFPPSMVESAPQGKYGDYVNHAVINQRLLQILGAFSFTVEREIYDGGQLTGVVCCLVAEVDGETVAVQEVGDVENPDNEKTNGARLKKATSDAFKRCAMRLGVGLHLWAVKSEYFLYDKLKESETLPTIDNSISGVAASVARNPSALNGSETVDDQT